MNELTPTIDAGKFEQLTKAADDPIKLELIRLTLSTAVPLAIADLRHVGGPSDWHFEQASAFATDLGAEGDNLLFRTKKTSAIMARFCEVVAILAFVPGGVTIFGLHFEATERNEWRELLLDEQRHMQASALFRVPESEVVK